MPNVLAGLHDHRYNHAENGPKSTVEKESQSKWVG